MVDKVLIGPDRSQCFARETIGQAVYRFLLRLPAHTGAIFLATPCMPPTRILHGPA